MKIWSVEEIELRLRQAAHTLRVLPRPKNGSPSSNMAAWPDIVRRVFHDAPKDLVVRVAVPPAAEITEMDEALQWLHWLTERERRIVWARACLVSLRKLAIINHCSHVTIRTAHREALLTIAARLNATVRVTSARNRFTNLTNDSILRR